MPESYITEYGRRLYGLCRTLCRNKEDADDLYQDTWLRVLTRFERFHPDSEFEPWLTAICVNLYRDRLRRYKRSPITDAFASSEEKELCLESVPSVPTPDYSYLHEAIDRLPDKLRITVILYYFSGSDLKRISSILKVPEGTVKSRLNKARQNLKEVLHDEIEL